MHLSKVFLVCLVCTLQLALAKNKGLGLGWCPKVQTKQDFNIEKFADRWYEYARYDSLFEYRRICTYSDIGLLPGGKMSIFISESNHVNSHKKISRGEATLVAPGKLSVSFERGWVKRDLWVLGTDYDNYAVVYSCSGWGFITQNLWILTRGTSPSKEVIEAAENILRQNKLPLKDLVKTKHDKCIYD